MAQEHYMRAASDLGGRVAKRLVAPLAARRTAPDGSLRPRRLPHRAGARRPSLCLGPGRPTVPLTTVLLPFG